MAGYGAKGIKKVGAYRSGLEAANMKLLEDHGVKAQYEQWSIPYVIPASDHKYTLDIILPNGIIIETKGLFETDDRKKHMLIRAQYPELDIRFVFSSSRTKLYKGSPTSYADWCIKNNILFADKIIPKSWVMEPKREIDWSRMVKKGGKK